jgi:hypothetical protein
LLGAKFGACDGSRKGRKNKMARQTTRKKSMNKIQKNKIQVEVGEIKIRTSKETRRQRRQKHKIRKREKE